MTQTLAAELQTVPYAQAIAQVQHRIEHGDVRLVARVNTPWTLLGLEAWLDRHWEGGEGYVLLMPNGIDEHKVWPASELRFIDRFPGIRAIAISPFSRGSYRVQNLRRGLLAARGLPSWARSPEPSLPRLDVIGPRMRDSAALVDLGPHRVFRRRHVQFHLLDEGFGDLPVRRGNAAVVEERSRVKQRAPLRSALVRAELLLRETIERAVRLRCSEQAHFLLSWDEASSRARVDEDVAASYRAVLDRYCPEPTFQRRDRPLAIVLTGCLSEFDTLSLDRELEMWDRVVTTLNGAGYDVLLKAHPRERQGKFDSLARDGASVQFLNGREAAEKVYQHLRPDDALVGLSSNSMLTGQLLYRLRTYTIDDLAKEYGVAAWLLEVLERYHVAFAHGLKFFRDLEVEAADHATRSG